MSEIECSENEKQIELQSNRIFMVATFSVIAAVCGVCVVAFGILLIIEYDINGLISLVAMFMLGLSTAGGAIGFRFYKGNRYIFTKDKIAQFKRDEKTDELLLEEIEKIEYYRYRFFLSIIAFFGGSLYTFTLYIKMKNGELLNWGFFSLKDVKRLKNELYGEFIQVK